MYLLLTTKKNRNRYHQTRFLGSKCTQNAFAAPGEFTTLPRPPSWIWGPLRDRERRGTGREGKRSEGGEGTVERRRQEEETEGKEGRGLA